MIALLNVHLSRFGGLDRPDYLATTPGVPRDATQTFSTNKLTEFRVWTDEVE